MIGLTLEERGAYNALIDHAYARDGDLPDDPHLISVMLGGVHGNKWRYIRRRLIGLGKIKIQDGRIVPNGVDATMKNAKKAAGGTRPPREIDGKSTTNRREIDDKSGVDFASKNPKNLANSTRARTRVTNTTTNTNRIESDRPTPDIPSRPGSAALGDLETRLRLAAGWQHEPAPTLCVVGAVQALVDAGADVDLDVLPTVRALAPRVHTRTGWKYFLGAIAQARDDRLAAGTLTTTPGETTNGRYQKNTIADGFAKVERVVDEFERRRNAARNGGGQENPRLLSRLREGPA